MIGTLAVAGRPRRMRQTSVPLSTRKVEIEDDQIGCLFGHRSKRGVAAPDDLDTRVSRSLERVLDEASDILFVLDHEHSRRSIHRRWPCLFGSCLRVVSVINSRLHDLNPQRSIWRERFRVVTARLSLG